MDKRYACRSNECFFHQTLVSMSDTFMRSTNNEKMTDAFKQFCDYFAENLNIKLS